MPPGLDAIGSKVERAISSGFASIANRVGQPAQAPTDFPTRVRQVQAALFLPFLAFFGFVVTDTLHNVIVTLLQSVNGALAGFLAPLLGVAMFIGLCFALFKWVASGGFGFFG